MPKVCVVTGKKPQYGNRVSHANNRANRRFEPNLQEKRFWVPSEKRFVKLKLSARAMRTIDKVGIDAVVADLKKKGVKF